MTIPQSRKDSALRLIKPTGPERETQTRVDTIEITPEIIECWLVPPFQRPLRVNAKVVEISEVIKQDGGVIPGILTLGVLAGKLYRVDGQHRMHAFLLSQLKTGYADVRYLYASDMAELGDEFVKLNSSIVSMRPDDVLRGLEGSIDALKGIRERCTFVGYDMVRRGSKAPMLSMSAAIRSWAASAQEVPAVSQSAVSIAKSLVEEDVKQMTDFLLLSYKAWGRDVEHARLWSALNLSLCMWLYRRLVITPWSPRIVRMTKDQFAKCMMSLSANADYTDWLLGRHNGERDRSPAYARVRSIFVKRMQDETGKKYLMPSPPWYAHR